MTAFREPARTLDVVESKRYSEDEGPYDGWTQDVDSLNNFITNSPSNTGLQWQWGGEKWDNKAMAVAWIDGHAKRLAFSDMCGINLATAPVGTTNYWGLQKGDADWATGMCDTLPQQFR
jgi:hypothetical protein